MSRAVFQATNRHGIPFNMTVTGSDPHSIVTFYDARFIAPCFHPELGQLVSSYYLSTLLDNRARLVASGLDLMGGVDAWFLDATAMSEVLTWLDTCLAA